jgi:tetratricopeptide (TPR) repeat protein
MKQLYSLLFCCILCSCAGKQEPVVNLVEAQSLYSQGDYLEATVRYEALVRTQPRDSELWFRLANSYARSGRPQAAVEAYRNALLRKPGMGKAWHNLAEVHLQMALEAYAEGRKYIDTDDPSLPFIQDKQERLMQILKPRDDVQE